MWQVEATAEWAAWFETLLKEAEQAGPDDETAADAVEAAVDMLEEVGPQLGRPLVDTLEGSQYPNMKELRVKFGERHLRSLFIFDPRRTALLLVGGDKTGKWSRWYGPAMQKAEELYADHLRKLEKGDT